LIAAVSSSVVAFLVISVLTLATGAACGYYFVRQRLKQSSSSNQPTEPLYDDVNALPTAVEHQEQGLELTENVAYGSAKTMLH
jgi:CHASE3 domain sensor protein